MSSPIAARQRVVRAEAEAGRRAPLDRQPHAAIALIAVIGVLVEDADQRRRPRVLVRQRQHAPLLQVAVGRAHRERDAVDRARTQAQEHAVVHRLEPPESVGVAAEVAGGCLPVGPELLFDRDVPRLNARRIQSRVDRGKRARRRELGVRTRDDRMRIAAREVAVGIVKASGRIGQPDAVAVGRRRRRVRHELAGRIVIRETIGRADAPGVRCRARPSRCPRAARSSSTSYSVPSHRRGSRDRRDRSGRPARS